MELGDRFHVAFGRGRWVLLYLVYRGRESNRLEERVIDQVHDLESRFAPILESWNGDMAALDGLEAHLAQTWDLPPRVPSTARNLFETVLEPH